nr:DNA repair protein complementing XP-C cells homolog [Leptinotarsa decemlineata]XP_023026813.1 DNA repair protein complementing XP-C cells homolog [Leptinotarsa decemlineata]
MPRTRSSFKNISITEKDMDEVPLKKFRSAKKKKNENSPQKKYNESSSSESDIENYLKPVNGIDFSSSFFAISRKSENEFNKIEKNIFSGVTRLSDSSDTDSENEKTDIPCQPATIEKEIHESSSQPNITKDFQSLQEYTHRIKEVKLQIEEYKAKKQVKESNLNISNLLAQGELKHETLDNLKEDYHSSDFESTDDDWEEVKISQQETNEKFEVPKKNLEIIVGAMPNHCKKKTEAELLAAMKRRLNRIRKINQIFVHKVHLLCWIAHGNYVNSAVNSSQVLAMALSLLPCDMFQSPETVSLSDIEQIIQWYRTTVTLIEKPSPKRLDFQNYLHLQINRKLAFNKRSFVFILTSILRALGLQCRLVFSFQVEPLRPLDSDLHTLAKKTSEKISGASAEASCTQEKVVEDSSSGIQQDTIGEQKIDKIEKNKTSKKVIGSKRKSEEVKAPRKKIENIIESKNNNNLSETDKNKKRSKSNSCVATLKSSEVKQTRSKSNSDTIEDDQLTRTKTRNLKNSRCVPQLDGVNDLSDELGDMTQTVGVKTKKKSKKATGTKKQDPPKNDTLNRSSFVKRRSSRIKIRSYGNDSEDEFVTTSQKHSPTRKTRLRKSTCSKALTSEVDVKYLVDSTCSTKLTNKRKSGYGDSDYDSDFMPELEKRKHLDPESKLSVPKTKKIGVIRGIKHTENVSDIKSKTPNKNKLNVDVWVEVYLETEKKWIAADIITGQVDCVSELSNRATQPINYIVAWNNDNTLKDITMKYCKSFNTVTRKLRADVKWWEETLKPFIGKKTFRDMKEDDDMNRQQFEQPLPKVISEYKNHPLYILKRHLLKYEAVYPPNEVPLGYVRGEPVYPRNSLYTCKSRKFWLKDGKVVKPGEEPYKIVSAPPRWDKINRKIVCGGDLEVFGEWQTMDFEPPTAENGVIPRNEYGNVELFKPNMLPRGTVHLKLPGLGKVCKKLNVDCATVVTGFEFKKGWTRAIYDGFVVCKQFEDQVVAAWEMEQEDIERRENEKIEKRVYDNWRKLIKGLLIRERLKAKYKFSEKHCISEKGKKSGRMKFNTKKRN